MRTDVMRTLVTPARPRSAPPSRLLVHGFFYLVAVGGALLFVLPLFWTIVWTFEEGTSDEWGEHLRSTGPRGTGG